MQKLDAPMDIPATSRNPAGMFPEVGEGRVYLVQTADDKFALVRVLEKTADALVVQYVYNPAGTMKFDVPVGEKVEYRRAQTAATSPATVPASTPEHVAASSTPTVPAIAPVVPRPPTVLPPPASLPALGPDDHVAPGIIVLRSSNGGSGSTGSGGSGIGSALEPSMDTFVRQREQMIQRRMAIVEATARTPEEMQRKSQAIFDLSYLHADAAADLFVSQIAFFNTRSAAKETSADAWLPCFAALKTLGKPATAAAIKGLKALDLDAPGEGIDSAMYHAGLLGQVIRAVEGEDVGNFILHREMEAETDAKRRAVFEFLLSKN
jgi:hypothetical protein